MSRALEDDAKASARAQNSVNVYNDIVQSVCFKPAQDLLEIEFLGKSHAPSTECNVLVDGNAVAIPKAKIVQAFVIARKIFFQCVKDGLKDKQSVRNSTSVILLTDPEHLTAANARKKVISTCRPEELKAALSAELAFIDSLLTSLLHRHTKSPTLWNHRRWLLKFCQSNGLPHDLLRDLKVVILVSAERHPRNYYAWSHLRWILQYLYQSQRNDQPGPSVTLSNSESQKLISAVKDWCLRHAGDTSGWSFLCFLLSTLETPEEGTETRMIRNSAICKEVLDLAISFKWTHESLWVFLRTLVASGNVTKEQQAGFLRTLKGAIKGNPADLTCRPVIQRSLDWCIQNSIES